MDEMIAAAGAAAEGQPQASASRKRPRDIRGIERFRQVVYGDHGFKRLHAMVARCPQLMYPPAGVEAARTRFMARLATVANDPNDVLQDTLTPPRHDAIDDAFFEELLREQHSAEGVQHSESPLAEVPHAAPVPERREEEPSSSEIADQELARYHHKQLDVLLKLMYEFSHLTFVKLPMSDVLQLLGRCGKESIAHLMEFETQLRLAREARLEDLRKFKADKESLQRRQLEMDTQRQDAELEEAEAMQRTLDAMLSEGEAAAMVDPAPSSAAENILTED